MQNDLNEKTHNINYPKELKLLNNKIITMSGYIIAMRSENIKETKKTEDTLKLLVKQTDDIKREIRICLITLWFLAILCLQKNF
ncbi:hypothetical protein [Candidatus Tisiphia endosymbiont of Nemotelus uliginosus]|uniref:hypothetical protein n=1 Tax=Candidatus Tisiphia endosymbiont of Nemotelus uliginosus TaxID=3077926 RepID=UPI0035C8ED01